MNNLNLFKRYLLAIICSIVFVGCKSTTPSFIVSPELQTNIVNKYQNNALNIQVNDVRSHQHLLQTTSDTLFGGSNAAELIRSNAPIANAIKKGLTSLLQQQGVKITSDSNKQIKIDVKEALINVSQNTMSYTTNNQITLIASIDNDGKIITKTYTSNGKGEGSMSADLAVLERDFNQQLGKLLVKIINDPVIENYIK